MIIACGFRELCLHPALHALDYDKYDCHINVE